MPCPDQLWLTIKSCWSVRGFLVAFYSSTSMITTLLLHCINPNLWWHNGNEKFHMRSLIQNQAYIMSPWWFGVFHHLIAFTISFGVPLILLPLFLLLYQLLSNVMSATAACWVVAYIKSVLKCTMSLSHFYGVNFSPFLFYSHTLYDFVSFCICFIHHH